MNKGTADKFYGNILQFLRTASVRDGILRWDGDGHCVDRLVELEEKHLHQWVGRFTVLIELARHANRKLLELKQTVGETYEQTVGKETTEAVAAAVVEYFTGIPYTYEYWAHLRGVVGLDLQQPLSISDMLTLEQVPQSEAKKGLGNALALALMRQEQRQLADVRAGDVVLRIRVQGYSSKRAVDSAPEEALAITKEFVTLAAASGVLAFKSSSYGPPTGLLMELPNGDYPNWITGIPEHVARHVDSYQLDEDVTHTIGGLLGGHAGERIERTSEERRELVAARLAPLRNLFHPKADRHAVALRTAAHWYFDASAEDNETNSFIFTSLGFEALLGGDRKEMEGLGLQKLIGNRLAYLMGGTREARDKLVKEFESFYGFRSGIVHGRDARLSYEARLMLSKGKYWLDHAIQKELGLLPK